MTIVETHRAVKLELDKSSALELPAFEPEEIDYWINKAIEQFVDGKYKMFEETQEVTEALKTLITSSIIPITQVSITRPNFYLASLSALTT